MKVFNDNFDVLLQKLNNEHASCFIAGDYNVNLLNNNIHSGTTTFIHNIFSQLFFPAISKPTRFSNNKSTLIDNIILNYLSGNCMSDILLSDISDHLPIFHIFDDLIVGNTHETVKSARIIDENRVSNFDKTLSAVNWDSV